MLVAVIGKELEFVQHLEQGVYWEGVLIVGIVEASTYQDTKSYFGLVCVSHTHCE
jgi:hypothetical protein